MRESKEGRGGRLTGVSGSLLVRRFSVRQPEMFRVIEAVTAQRLTSIDKAALCELAQTVMDLEFDGIEGDFLEVSRGSGGASTVIEKAKHRTRSFSVYDLSRGELESISGEWPLALAHLDCGEYEPMRVLLERLVPRLVPGGHLIIDDYRTQEECRRAVDEYFRGRGGFQLVRKSRLHVIKN